MQDNVTRIRVNVAGNSSFVTPMRLLKKQFIGTGIEFSNSGSWIKNRFLHVRNKKQHFLNFTNRKQYICSKKSVIKFLKLTKLRHKKQPKRDMLRLLPYLLIKLVFYKFFYLKAKIEYLFSFYSSFSVLIFTFHMHAWMATFFEV